MAFASDARTRAHWPRVLRARAAMHMGGFYSPRPWPTKGGQGGRGKGTRCRRRKPRACRGDALMITYVIHVHACFLFAHMQYHRNLSISDRYYGNCNQRNPIQYRMLRFAISPRRRGGEPYASAEKRRFEHGSRNKMNVWRRAKCTRKFQIPERNEMLVSI